MVSKRNVTQATQDRSDSSATSGSLGGTFSTIGWPVLIGLALTSIFFVLIFRGPLNLPVMHRYFASHPVTYCETALFFIGLVALLMKLFAVLGEYAAVSKVRLEASPAEGSDLTACGRLLDSLDDLPAGVRDSFLARRLRDALEIVERSDSSAGLSDELKYLADAEAARQQESFSLVRIVVWATPMLGFLGTVMGITEALGDLSANAKMLATSIDTAIQGLLGGLYVAFDTTALALTLSMVLMFIQFVIERMETQLLGVVDTRANEELIGRFIDDSPKTDPHLASIERMVQSVVKATEQLVLRQAQLWQGTIDSANDHWKTLFTSAQEQLRTTEAASHEHWQRMFQHTGEQMQTTLATAMERSLQSHADQLVAAEQKVAEQISSQWSQVQTGLTEHAMLLLAQQTELAKHGDTMVKVLTATSDIIKLETALNDNLTALSGAKNFEDTVMSLSAAIHLLNTKLGKSTDAPSVDLSRSKPTSKAA